MQSRARAAAVLSLSAVALAAAAAGAAAKPRDRRGACGRSGARCDADPAERQQARREDDEVPPPRKALAQLEVILRQIASAFRRRCGRRDDDGGGAGAFLRVLPDLARAVIRHFAWLYRAVILRAAERLLAAARSARQLLLAGPSEREGERQVRKRSRRRGRDATVRSLRINEVPRHVGPEFGPVRAGGDENKDDVDDDDDDEVPELAPTRDDEVFGADDATDLPAERLSPAVKAAFGTGNGAPERNTSFTEMT